MTKKWYLNWWVIIVALLLGFLVLASQGSPIAKDIVSQNFRASTTPIVLGGATSTAEILPVTQVTATNQKSIASSSLLKVIKVIDGDTIDVDISGKVTRLRLIGMDTPEVVDPRKPVQCFGREASAKAKELLSGQSVRLESDPSQGELDKYDRTLRYVYLADGRSFNKLMIEEGYAHEYTYDIPYKYQKEYKAAQKTAEAGKRGLWADNACQGDTTKNATPPVTNSAVQSPAQTSPTGHIFYVSSYHTAKYYYCDTDTTWKGLSSKYIKNFSSETELLKAYPDKTLHEACK